MHCQITVMTQQQAETAFALIKSNLELTPDVVYDALLKCTPELADIFAQIKRDIQDSTRTSWVGTAHEIREVIARLLRILAPDTEVQAQSWYIQDKNTSGPTQKQQACYVMEQRGASSKQTEVVEKVGLIEELIGALVRATYTRAADASHRSKEQSEVARILRYSEAFLHDLLNLK